MNKRLEFTIKLRIGDGLRWMAKFTGVTILAIMMGVIARWYVAKDLIDPATIYSLVGWFQATLYFLSYRKWFEGAFKD